MTRKWHTFPGAKIGLQLQQLTARLQRLLLNQRLQTAKKLLEKQNGR